MDGDGITDEELYREIVAAYKMPPPPQPGDITVRQFATDTGMSWFQAKRRLEQLTKAGRMVRVMRRVTRNPEMCYRFVEE